MDHKCSKKISNSSYNYNIKNIYYQYVVSIKRICSSKIINMFCLWSLIYIALYHKKVKESLNKSINFSK